MCGGVVHFAVVLRPPQYLDPRMIPAAVADRCKYWHAAHQELQYYFYFFLFFFSLLPRISRRPARTFFLGGRAAGGQILVQPVWIRKKEKGTKLGIDSGGWLFHVSVPGVGNGCLKIVYAWRRADGGGLISGAVSSAWGRGLGLRFGMGKTDGWIEQWGNCGVE